MRRDAPCRSAGGGLRLPRIERRSVCVAARHLQTQRESPRKNQENEALLCRMFRAHEAPVTAAVVVADNESQQHIVTSSLDRSLAYWRLHQVGLDTNKLEAARIACGRPVLSITGNTERVKDGVNSVYCGRTGGENEIVCWDPPKAGFHPRVMLGPHGGWVRDLKSQGRWMFSCDCNTLRQWDLSWSNPRHLRNVSLYKGDILSIAVGGEKVFVGVSDGSIHSWDIQQNGKLVPAATCQAHKGRINAIVWDDGVLYSAGNDGHLKSWDADSLDSIRFYYKAHGGKKINCLAVGPDSVIYSGSEGEGAIRRWNGRRLYPHEQPLLCHHASVRVLSFGSNNALVSGDADGVVSIWKV